MGFYGDEIFIESLDRAMANPISVKGQISTTIKAINKKLDSLNSKEEKKAYLDK